MSEREACPKCRESGWIRYVAMGEECSSPCDHPLCDAADRLWLSMMKSDIDSLLAERDRHLQRINDVEARRRTSL